MPADEQHLADRLLAGLAAVREHRFQEAIAPLREVEIGLRDQADLRDVYARAACLLAQAELQNGDATAARAANHSAMAATRELGDLEGLTEIRALDERIAAQLDRERRQALARARSAPLVALSLEQVEQESSTPIARADALIKHATALQSHERPADAARSAARAIHHADESGAVRERVLARIVLSEVDRDRASEVLPQALQIADHADETTLIGLVARASDLADVPLPRQYGPLMHGEKG